MMKILIPVSLVFLFFFSPALDAQSFGVSAQGVVLVANHREIIYNPGYGNPRTVQHVNNFLTGIRIEGNYILPGFGIPVSAYNGIGVTLFAPATDSAVFRGQLANNNGTIDVLGTRKFSSKAVSLRFAYEFPQSFNDFLLIHYGWGFHYSFTKSTNILPAQSPTFNYEASDFSEETFEPNKTRGLNIEVMAGCMYELEKFSLSAQYGVYIPLGNFTGTSGLRHGLSAGIYYPLYRL